ncbi:MAG: NAD+ synthase [Fibrobacterota bacterium]
MDTLRIALAQLNFCVGDCAGNAERILRALDQAEAAAADIALFPELAVSGYPPEDLLLRKDFLDQCRIAARGIAARTRRCMAVFGTPLAEKGRLYNAALIAQDGKIRAVYHKILLPNYSVFDEKRYFDPGQTALSLDIGKVRLGVTICEDVWHADGPVQSLRSAGTNLLINISASPYHRGKILEREKALGKTARSARMAIAYCNLVGGQDELVFDGGSFILNDKGRPLARAPQFSESFLLADISFPHQQRLKKRVSRFPVKNTVLVGLRPKQSALHASVMSRMAPVEEVFAALTLGIRDYARKNGFSKALLGLSGGIDSALVAVLAAEALDPENVLCLSMPTIYSSDGTRSDARCMAELMGISFREISIQELFAQFKEALRPDFDGLPEGLAEENLQARLRANLLMTYSNKFGHLLLSTGNKSEASVGYCTIYGDMAGGFAPIKDIPKKLVYELSEFYNMRCGRDIIPRSVIDRPPTAELRPNQKDSDSLPPYPVLDEILRLHVEEHNGEKELLKRGFEPETIRRIVRLVKTSEYKRRQAAPGIKITTLAFGKDRRMPITNYYESFNKPGHVNRCESELSDPFRSKSLCRYGRKY